MPSDQPCQIESGLAVPSMEIRDRHACLAIVLAHKTALGPEAGAQEPKIADHDALQTQQLVEIDGLPTGLCDGAAPSLNAVLPRTLAFDGEAGSGVIQQEESGCPRQ